MLLISANRKVTLGKQQEPKKEPIKKAPVKKAPVKKASVKKIDPPVIAVDTEEERIEAALA